MRVRSVLLPAALAVLLAGGAASQNRRVDFARDIRPVLSENCFACHGPDEKARMAELRLDTRDGALAQRKTGAAIVAGDPARSNLYQRITSADKAERMPPAFTDKQLTPRQIELVKLWIEQGAEWETHWALVPPKRPEPPAVKNAAWPRNPIDHLVLARLESEGLKPSPEADRTTLIRRLALDLTGLPPSPAEVDAFLADKSADAYDKLVDRLVTSPHHGERLAMHWLDLARYADTHGYHIDSHRDMWHWRDWVVGAFNRNMRFDEFTIWQIAGDLLPNATRDQKLASGFNRNHMINFEGGAIAEEYQAEYVADRVETTSKAWLGLTMNCARCHDHKYDPIKQKEFYEFFAFFNNVSEKGLDGRRGNAEPFLQLTTPEQEQRVTELKDRIKEREKTLEDEAIAPLLREWENTRVASMRQPTRDGLRVHYEFDGHLSDTSGAYQHARPVRGEITYGEGAVARAGTLSGETHVEFGRPLPFDSRDAFTMAFWMRSGGIREMPILQKVTGDAARRGFEVILEESFPISDLRRAARIAVRLTHRWPDEAIVVRTREAMPLTQKQSGSSWRQITITYDGSGKAAGLKIHADGRAVDVEALRDSLTASIANDRPLSSGDKSLGIPFKGALDDLRIYGRILSPDEIEQLTVHEPVRALLLEGPDAKRSKTQKEKLRDYFLTHDAPEKLRQLYAELNELSEERERLEKVIPTSMAMAELKKPRETFILARGDYRRPTEKVRPGVPAVLPPLPEGAPRNRLALAKWLVDERNPLTARVTVNWFWQNYFGAGLVRTSEDFGTRGELPSHPELLDWLATEFVRTGWDVRAMQRLIVTSAAYRQTSQATRALIAKDPDNRLLARGPRFRLPAEIVRDNALAASGLLVPKLGGPSVFPYQPKGLWEEIAYGDVYSAQTYAQDKGESLYRRSMYTFWKRTSPPPSLLTFDAPDREKCIARRARTNTPLQALVLMNDPTFVEASRALAERVLLAERSNAARLRLAFRTATARMPDPREMRVLEELTRKQLAHYRRNGAADKLLTVGESRPDSKVNRAELAAWTTVASVILSMDETITKE